MCVPPPGLTETYGPAVVCEWKPEWRALGAAEQAKLRSRQGVNYHALEDLQVMDPETMTPAPADGKTLGEVMMRGNMVMKGYLDNDAANAKDFAGGWYHSGDLAVRPPPTPACTLALHAPAAPRRSRRGAAGR